MKLFELIKYPAIIIVTSIICLTCIKRPPLDDVNYVETYTAFSIRKMVSPSFYFDVLSFYKDDEGRADIYLKVGYDKLVFLKENEINVARYNCRIMIINEDTDSILVNTEFEKKITIEEWKVEFNNYYDFNLKSFKLPNGYFIVSIKISDLNSTKSFSKLERIVVDFSKDYNLQASDLLLVQKVNNQNGQIRLSPMISKHIPLMRNDSIFSFYEVYSGEEKRVTITTNLVKLAFSGETDIEFITSYRNFDKYYLKPWEVKAYNSVYYETADTVIKAGTNPLILKLAAAAEPGSYLLYSKIKDREGKDSLLKHVRFTILPEGFPKIVSIDDKIALSKLVARVGESKFFPDSMTAQEKYDKFDAFWSNSSDWNREEFFRRAEFANERFTSLIEGWKTPMGKVYSICGEPDMVDGDKWIYQDYVMFDFAVIKDKGRYEIDPPMVVLRWYSDNAYNFWRRAIDKCRTY